MRYRSGATPGPWDRHVTEEVPVLAFSNDIYLALKLVHVLAAVVWLGAGIYFQIQATRLKGLDDPARLAQFTRDVEFAGQRLLLPASGVVLLAGIVMVVYAPFLGFSDTWIWLGLVGYGITAITGSIFIGPTTGKLGKLIEAEGPDASGVQALQRRLFAISRIDQLVLIGVVAVMVFKPGA